MSDEQVRAVKRRYINDQIDEHEMEQQLGQALAGELELSAFEIPTCEGATVRI